MASDQDYMAFLDKANNDADEAHANAAKTQSGARAQLKALDAGQTAPKSIVDVCKEAVYTSDADEPFEQVSLKYTGANGLPDEGTFYSRLIPFVAAGRVAPGFFPFLFGKNATVFSIFSLTRLRRPLRAGVITRGGARAQKKRWCIC